MVDIRTIDIEDLRDYLSYYQGINNCKNIRNLAIIDLLSSSGMRISELVNLNIEDINFENKSCIVFGKGKKMREVYSEKIKKIDFFGIMCIIIMR